MFCCIKLNKKGISKPNFVKNDFKSFANVCDNDNDSNL